MQTQLGALATLSLLSVVSCASLSGRAVGDTFGLFAYGPKESGIGGFPVLYKDDGYAYIGGLSAPNSSFALPSFTVDSTSSWIANPNTTVTNSTATFSDRVFFVPGAGSSSRQVGFLASNSTNSSDVTTSGFGFYGHVATLTASSGEWQTLFYAVATDTEGIWLLNWNATAAGEDGAIPVTLKDTAPPNVDAMGVASQDSGV